ncbi:ADP compounds hydrolase NudE [Vibrio stylophorae]|uniref:ADP compounds hydrolase NudE n=1 Tax=Vibrio stylophorae TaxID=659351 RepID=A0ABM8ZQJ1_9VIBR|nr:ADP compounds hydrolase NudE [Vibrio stylophorae]CAH0532347.1 ADP compounds hydrolase NudE [Vibrio stylophorae]
MPSTPSPSAGNRPIIRAIRSVAQSKLFHIEALDLRFSNGVERTYERMKPSGREAVMIVPVTANQELVLIREYACGTHQYELGFPKGLVDLGESAEQAANRELTEEVSLQAAKLEPLTRFVLAPSYFSSEMSVWLAQDLTPASAEGDEPEPLEVVYWPIDRWQELLTRDDFREARAIAALLLAQRHLGWA